MKKSENVATEIINMNKAMTLNGFWNTWNKLVVDKKMTRDLSKIIFPQIWIFATKAEKHEAKSKCCDWG